MTTTTKQTTGEARALLEQLRLNRIAEIDEEIESHRISIKGISLSMQDLPDPKPGDEQRWSDRLNHWESESLRHDAEIEDLTRRRDAILAGVTP